MAQADPTPAGQKSSVGVFYCVLFMKCAAICCSERKRTMSSLYEDNFGFYAIDDDPEELAFFLHIKKQSIGKKCVRCKKKVRLQPSIIICASCSSALEYGAPSDPAWVVTNHWPVSG